jgi:hypothetical protein
MIIGDYTEVSPYQVRFTSVSKLFATFANVEVGTAPSPWYGCPGQHAHPHLIY